MVYYQGLKIVLGILYISVVAGMKVSCTHLQCAAWAFQQVRDNFNSTYAADWTYDILSFQEQTMLVSVQFVFLYEL